MTTHSGGMRIPALTVCLYAAAVILCAAVAHAAPEATAAAAEASGAAAAASATSGSGPIPGSEFTWSGYVQAIGIMFLVLALLWAVLWALRRFGRLASMPRGMGRDALYMERQLQLGPRKHLVVVRFLNKRLLLGVTDHQITLLSETEPHNDQLFQRCLDAEQHPDPAPPPAAP